jgi:hypothetical protein
MADPGFRIFDLELLIEGQALAMAHVRTQLRNAVAARLAGLATTGANVFDSRPPLTKWPDADLPGLSIATPSDDFDPEGSAMKGPNAFDLTLEVTVRAKGTDCVAVGDQAAAEIQAAIAADETLGGIAKHCAILTTTTSTTGDLESPVAELRLEFAVGYRINPSDAETSIR